MPTRHLWTALMLTALLGADRQPWQAAGLDQDAAQAGVIVSGTAVGFAGPALPLVEELVVHNDGLVTLRPRPPVRSAAPSDASPGQQKSRNCGPICWWQALSSRTTFTLAERRTCRRPP